MGNLRTANKRHKRAHTALEARKVAAREAIANSETPAKAAG